MTTPSSITVEGVTYVPESNLSGDVRIVIAQRGWVFVGRYTQDGENVVVTAAKVVRKWGTTAGLGELCAGPKSSTILDPAGTVRLHTLAIVATFDADPNGWDL